MTMKRIKVNDHFFLDELVHPDIYKRWGARALQFLDYRMIQGISYIERETGLKVTVNNWIDGGPLQNRGLRPFNSPTGAAMSQHKFGRAYDVNVATMTPAELNAWLTDLNRSAYLIEMGMITTIESDTPTWTHLDNRYHPDQGWEFVWVPFR